MTEPSPEAVELARKITRVLVRSEEEAWVVSLVDSALRALEQRTRLETLEMAAKKICVYCADPVTWPLKEYPVEEERWRWRHPDASRVCDSSVLWSEIASLQPREACPHGPHVHEVFRSGVKEGEITCDGPREAPKQVPCRSCGGDGWTEAGAVVGARCLSCNGSGREAPKAEEPKR